MKKLAAIAAAAALALCLSGCGMTEEEYEKNLDVQYLVSGEFASDIAALNSSLSIDEDKDLDYEAWSNLETHCENIINLEGCPKEYEEAHESLVKAANNLLGQIDIFVDCAASLETYRITDDTSLLKDATDNLATIPTLLDQAADYVKDAKEIIEAS